MLRSFCSTADPSDALRMNAVALKLAALCAAGDALRRLIRDANIRIRLIAATCLLATDRGDAGAGAVLVGALGDPDARVRKAAPNLVESLGASGAAFLGVLKERHGLEEEVELRDVLAPVIDRLVPEAGSDLQPVVGSFE